MYLSCNSTLTEKEKRNGGLKLEENYSNVVVCNRCLEYWSNCSCFERRRSRLEVREECMMSVTKEDKEDRQTSIKWVGRKSNWQVDYLDLWLSSDISTTVESLSLTLDRGNRKRNKLNCMYCSSIWLLVNIFDFGIPAGHEDVTLSI